MRIKTLFETDKQIAKGPRDGICYKIFRSRIIKREEWDFICKQESKFWSKDVWEQLKIKLNIKVDPTKMAKFMKSELNLSFKKATLRPINLNVKRQQLLKILFSVRIAKQLEKWKCIVNIDEASISRLTKRSYSWFIRGAPGLIKNTSFSGSFNVISAI